MADSDPSAMADVVAKSAEAASITGRQWVVSE